MLNASYRAAQLLYEYIGTRTSVREQGAGAGAWTINRLPCIVTKVSNDSKLKLLRTCIVNGVLESFIRWHPMH